MHFSKLFYTTLFTGLAIGTNASAEIAAPLKAGNQVSGIYADICKNTTKEEIQGLFKRWNDSLATLDPDKVVANYSDDGVLLPTVSNTPRTNHAEIRDYFVHFLQKKPQGVINKSHVKIGCNKASDVGVYTFALADKQGKVNHVVARYSYVYDYKDGQWLISHHHSSVMPEVVSAKSKVNQH